MFVARSPPPLGSKPLEKRPGWGSKIVHNISTSCPHGYGQAANTISTRNQQPGNRYPQLINSLSSYSVRPKILKIIRLLDVVECYRRTGKEWTIITNVRMSVFIILYYFLSIDERPKKLKIIAREFFGVYGFSTKSQKLWYYDTIKSYVLLYTLYYSTILLEYYTIIILYHIISNFIHSVLSSSIITPISTK